MQQNSSETRKIRVLLSPSYFYQFDPKQWRDKKPYPPYGTLYAAAYLRMLGFDVQVFDTHLCDSPEKIEPILNSGNFDYFIIYDDGFNYLTKMCLTAMRSAAFQMINYAKEIGTTVVVNNSDASDHYEKYLRAGAHFVVTGEGEISLGELLQKLSANDTSANEVPGTVTMIHQEVLVNPKRPILQDLDLLPDPDWELINIEAYKKIWLENHGYFSLNIATTRGCPFKCNWCAKPIYGNRYNSRSAQRVAQEMKHLQTSYGVEHFWIADDIFALKPGWIDTFAAETRRLSLNIKYKIQSRADLLVQANYVRSLAESGLSEAWIGAESGSQKILDAMDKGITVDQIHEATHLLKSHNVRVGFFLQFGYIDENWDDIRKTLRMVKELLPEDIGVSVSYPLPGTKFFEKVKDQLVEKQNWTDSDDLDMMYQGTFSKSFYKILHRYVHCVFRTQQGLDSLKRILSFSSASLKSTIYQLTSLAYYVPMIIYYRARLYTYMKEKLV
ncbi:MAG: B12-binding domain-containing radical SAM protein [Saprospiraceae bacterium]|nr:B12-binding domain-containing radical SAM protein [Saprospiraceae bacterium]